MNNLRSKSIVDIGRFPRKSEAGMALVVVLLLLLLISAIGLGMVYMSNSESAINSNYRDSQLAFYAMRGGLEEARDRMRTTSPWPLGNTLPAVLPGNANSILYITNPAAGENVDPKTAGNAYFDDEFCHENFNLGLANPGVGVPCTAAPPLASVSAYVNSISPNTTTASALKYKWARITLKENGTFANGVAANYVDSTQPATTQVCYQSLAGQEIPVTLVPGGPFASCAAAVQAGQNASPVYVVTSLAVTANGSRRVGQYEMAAVNVSAPPTALGMDGPGAVFNPTPNSNNYFIQGTDSGAAGFTNPGSGNAGTGACNPSGATVPAISTGDSAGVNNITTQLQGPPDRSAHYTGSGATPSIANGGPGGTGAFNGQWSTPAQLDNMVNALASVANNSYSCGINGVGGAACTPGSVGSAGNPQITYVNGDFNYGNTTTGEGVLIVTGTLTFTGNAAFNGLILVIGQGAMSASGGGNGGINGSVFMANTHSHTAPFPELTTLGTPTIAISGGGNSFLQYNSCWANVLNGSTYTVVAGREEMY